MNISPISVQGFQNVQVIPSQNLRLDFQNSIKQGNADLMTTLIAKGLFVNQPLPNGELPLHFAVRENKENVVSILLKHGALPEILDSQQLNAIDHAILMKHETILSIVLGHKIGKELEKVQNLTQCESLVFDLSNLQDKIKHLLTINGEKLYLLNQAVLKGNIEYVKQAKDWELHEKDENGLCPIDYAYLTNQPEIASFLFTNNCRTTQADGTNLAHLAVVSKNMSMIDLLDKETLTGLINQCDNQGRTPLHYAAATSNFTAIETLIKKGANLYQQDEHGATPLQYIAAHAFQNDPLSLTKDQLFFFALSALFWFSYLAAQGMDVSDKNRFIITGLSVATTCGFDISDILNQKDREKRILTLGIFLSLLGVATLSPTHCPLIAFGIAAWGTAHVAKSTFERLKSCGKNIGYRNWDVAKNIIVHGIKGAQSFWKFNTIVHYMPDAMSVMKQAYAK